MKEAFRFPRFEISRTTLVQLIATVSHTLFLLQVNKGVYQLNFSLNAINNCIFKNCLTYKIHVYKYQECAQSLFKKNRCLYVYDLFFLFIQCSVIIVHRCRYHFDTLAVNRCQMQTSLFQSHPFSDDNSVDCRNNLTWLSLQS